MTYSTAFGWRPRACKKKHFNPHLCSWIDIKQNTSQWWRLSLFSFHIHWIKPKAVLTSTTVIQSVPLKVLGLVPSPNTRAPLSPRCPTPLCVCMCVCHRVKERERDMRGDPCSFDSHSRKWEVLGKVQPTEMNNQSTTRCHAVVAHLKLIWNVKSRQNVTFISLACALKLWHLSIYCLWVNFHRRHVDVVAGKAQVSTIALTTPAFHSWAY